ncbi:hypothetical protein B4064_0707 [Caldibacillus thermoamylovorans]|nr:hypothetical protein B4064_0707 [Caldibacillus thermoamylovorans]
MATRSILVVIFWPETPFFGDEIHSRRHFLPEPPFFGDEALSRRQFEAGNFTFLAMNPVLVVILRRKEHYFGDEL